MYSRFSKKLHTFLNPHLIGIHTTDVFEETLLKVAEIETAPTKCRFDSSNNRLKIKLSGITSGDADKFAAFLRDKCADPDVVLKNKDGDTFSFKAKLELVEDKILQYFQAGFGELSTQVLDQYKLKSLRDPAVRDYKERALYVDYSSLIDTLKSTLTPQYISIHKTDIFEETLLQLAGVSAQPQRCQFGPVDDTKMYFRIRGINEEEAEKFLAFLKMASKDLSLTDNSATRSYVTENKANDFHNFHDSIIDAHHFEVSKKVAKEVLLPLFIEALPRISMEKRTAYKKQSESDWEISHRIQSERREKHEKLMDTIENFLIPQMISSLNTDAFEETILKMAQVETQPARCQFFPVDGQRMQIRFKGLEAQDLEKLSAFFKITCGDETATMTYVSRPQTSHLRNELVEAHSFDLDIEMVLSTLIPRFTDAFASISEEKRAQYETLSAENDQILLLSLGKTIDAIGKLTLELEAACVNEFTKGELHVINLLLDSVMISANNPIEALGSLKRFVDASQQIFNKMREENTDLKDNEGAIKLNQHFDTFIKNAKKVEHASFNHRSLQQLGLFGRPSSMPVIDLLTAEEDVVCTMPMPAMR